MSEAPHRRRTPAYADRLIGHCAAMVGPVQPGDNRTPSPGGDNTAPAGKHDKIPPARDTDKSPPPGDNDNTAPGGGGRTPVGAR